MRAFYGTLRKTELADSDRYREYEAVIKKLARVHAVYQWERIVEF